MGVALVILLQGNPPYEPQTAFVFQWWTLHNPVREHPVMDLKNNIDLLTLTSSLGGSLEKNKTFLLLSQVVPALAGKKDLSRLWRIFALLCGAKLPTVPLFPSME